MAKQKKVLRVVFYPERFTTKKDFSIFDGDIEKDRKYWKKYHNADARYFKLEEV